MKKNKINKILVKHCQRSDKGFWGMIVLLISGLMSGVIR